MLSLFLIAATGCADRTELDESSLVTIIGMDTNDNRELTLTGMVLDFNEESKSQEILLSGKVQSLREARSVLGAKSAGEFLSGKLQVMLLSRSLLQKIEMMPYLDVVFRDAKFSNSALLAACDCSVKKLMEGKWNSQPILTEYIRKLIETGHRSEMTVRTTLQNFHYMQTEEGVTAAISEIKPLGKEISVTGTMLLNNSGKMALHLNREESALLLLLQNKFEPPVSYTTTIHGDEGDSVVSFDMKKAKAKVRTAYSSGKFQFHIRVPIRVEIAELDGPYHLAADKKLIESLLTDEVEHAFKSLIGKLQSHKVDPVGYGLYARAFQYEQWKEVREDWGAAFGQADVEIQVTISIDSFGVIE